MYKKFLPNRPLLAACLLASATIFGSEAASAQAVIFPQLQQPGTAQALNGDTEGTLILKNDLLTAVFTNTNGKLAFGGCEQLGLHAGTELFTITLGDGVTVVPASQMDVTSWELVSLTGDPNATVASEKLPGHCIKSTLTYGDLTFEWRAILRDGSHYLRTELKLTAGKDVEMHNIIPMIYEVDAANAPAVVGNTRGALLASSTIFAGLETPMGLNTIELPADTEPSTELTADDGFNLNGWSPDTYNDYAETPVANPYYWKWTPESEECPTAIKNLGFAASEIRGKRGFAAFESTGNHTVTFQYTSGSHGLNVVGVDLVDMDGKVVASDYHIGFTGGASRDNVYTLDVPEAGTYLVRYFIEIKTETVTASGTITWNPTVTATTKPATASGGSAASGNDNRIIQGLWSRHTTLQAGKTWEVGAVVGLIAPEQARRSFLAYSERERAVPWRAFPIYNSWYELNIDRNNSATYDGHMTSTDCVNVVNQWRENLYDKYDANIKSFVWDDGWDEYGTWTFNKNFPNGFREPDDAAVAMHSGTGAWLGPVGGYGTSGNLRRQYWTNKGGMQLSNPAYYKVFLDACQNMVDNYDFNFFKLDGISAQGNAVGPDAGYTGEENAEGIIDILSRVREIRPDMFFNTTVGTWASPFWFHYTDAVWRQDADWSTIGNQGDDRERWITYRDYMVYKNFTAASPLCPINTLMTHGFILTEKGDVSRSMNYEGIVRELRCAFACGSGMVELYCDAKLLNSINNGALWGDIAECIKWQEKNADVLPDVHWVGGNPWDGTKANVYGWAAWNGEKATLALRNPATAATSYTFTLREALDIPAYVTTPLYFTPAFDNQVALAGFNSEDAFSLDTPITVQLPGSSVYVFDGSITAPEAPIDAFAVTIAPTEHGTVKLMNGDTEVISGRKVDTGTELTIVTNPDYGYLVNSIEVNGVELEGNTFTVESTTEVTVTFARDPQVTAIYQEPDGNVRSNTYVEAISSNGATEEIDVTYSSLPARVFNLIDQTLVAAPGQSFDINLKAFSLGAGSNTVVRQDLRYDAAYVFVDWYGTAQFTFDKMYGTLPPAHNVYGNYDQVMDINHSLTMPSDVPDGTLGRIRFLYANAWTIPGTDSALNLGNGYSSADCDPNSQFVTDGVCYDIPVKANVLAAIDGIGTDASDAPVEYFNIQGMRIDARNLTPGLYIRRQGNDVQKVYISK